MKRRTWTDSARTVASSYPSPNVPHHHRRGGNNNKRYLKPMFIFTANNQQPRSGIAKVRRYSLSSSVFIDELPSEYSVAFTRQSKTVSNSTVLTISCAFLMGKSARGVIICGVFRNAYVLQLPSVE